MRTLVVPWPDLTGCNAKFVTVYSCRRNIPDILTPKRFSNRSVGWRPSRHSSLHAVSPLDPIGIQSGQVLSWYYQVLARLIGVEHQSFLTNPAWSQRSKSYQVHTQTRYTNPRCVRILSSPDMARPVWCIILTAKFFSCTCCSLFDCTLVSVSYTHLTLPTNREV